MKTRGDAFWWSVTLPETVCVPRVFGHEDPAGSYAIVLAGEIVVPIDGAGPPPIVTDGLRVEVPRAGARRRRAVTRRQRPKDVRRRGDRPAPTDRTSRGEIAVRRAGRTRGCIQGVPGERSLAVATAQLRFPAGLTLVQGLPPGPKQTGPGVRKRSGARPGRCCPPARRRRRQAPREPGGTAARSDRRWGPRRSRAARAGRSDRPERGPWPGRTAADAWLPRRPRRRRRGVEVGEVLEEVNDLHDVLFAKME
jgi:hypothetical protein